MRQEVLRFERVSFQQQGVMRLEDFSLSIFSGEIVGLLPINNHGLTALLQLLQHNLPLRFGYVYYRGEQVNTWRTKRHRDNRIGLIQSESNLVEGMTVLDNIFVLRPGFRTWLIRPRVLEHQLFPFLEKIGIHISASAYVDELGPFQKVVVAILKSVVSGCKLIVLQEIGTKFTESELERIHKLLRHYSRQGFSFLYIGFHHEELQAVCDKVALMSNGRIIKVLEQASFAREMLQHYTEEFSGKVLRQLSMQGRQNAGEQPVLTVEGLSAGRLEDLSFSAYAGECLVLQDVDSHVYRYLLPVLLGEAGYGGQFCVRGVPVVPGRSRELAVIQELPSSSMLFAELSYLDNLCFTSDHRLPELWRSSSVRRGIRQEYTPELGPEVWCQRVDSLSEMQKYTLAYTRIAMQMPGVVFCMQPFRQADMALRMHIWDLIKGLLGKGIAVVILAVNLADSLTLADRLIRLRRSRPNEMYLRSAFPTMSIGAPWVEFYREQG